MHREEYNDHEYGYGNEYGDSLRVYYIVIGQEFVEDFDYYNGISLGYIPISDVYFVVIPVLQLQLQQHLHSLPIFSLL